MKEIGKKLPYEESEKYLDGLIQEMAQRAIVRQGARRHRGRAVVMITSAAAAVLLVVGIGLTVFNHSSKASTTALQAEGPIDEFLNSLSDQEVAQLPYYEIEEIPEY